MSSFAIGDIHGCLEELELLLGTLPLKKDSQLIFLGDYIDRGDQSKEVIEYLIELRKKRPIVTLCGNHEAMMLDFILRPNSPGAGIYIMNGGSATLASYADDKGQYWIPDSHIEFLLGLKRFHQDEKFFYVHAGVPDLPLHHLDPKEHEAHFLWARQPFIKSHFNWGKPIVHGHTPCEEVEILPTRINVDTGCIYGNKLSAIELPSRKIFSVPGRTKGRQLILRDSTSKRIAIRFDGKLPVSVRYQNQSYDFETLNYNEFGFLIGALSSEAPTFVAGDIVYGVAGQYEPSSVDFEGDVVRTELKDGRILYGIKFRKIKPHVK